MKKFEIGQYFALCVLSSGCGVDNTTKEGSSLRDRQGVAGGMNLTGLRDEERLQYYRPGYEQLWNNLKFRSEYLSEIDQYIRTIAANKDRYSPLELKTGVPWYVIGIIHGLEADFKFNAHLHNGDSLSHRTWQVPAGRPALGNPPFTWEYSALDALKYEGFLNWSSWNDPAVIAFAFENYNGFGYRNTRINSPYLWSYSTNYSRGKFVSDGSFDPMAKSDQAGAMVLLKRGIELGIFTLGTPASLSGEVAADAQPPLNRELFEGESGKDVELMQMRLADYGADFKDFSGTFDTKTKAADEQFQKTAQLAVDGVVGRATWGKMWPSFTDVNWIKTFKITNRVGLLGMDGTRCLFRVDAKTVHQLAAFMKLATKAESIRDDGPGAPQSPSPVCPDSRRIYDLNSSQLKLVEKTEPPSNSKGTAVTWHRLSQGPSDIWHVDSFAGTNLVTSIDTGSKVEILNYFEKHSRALNILNADAK